MESMLISLLVFIIIAAIVWYVLQQLDLPKPIKMAVVGVFAIIAIVYLLKFI